MTDLKEQSKIIIIDELSTNTQFIVTSSSIYDIEWEYLNNFINEMEDLDIPIKKIKGIQEWGQDFIKMIYMRGYELEPHLILRNKSEIIVNSIKKELGTNYVFMENISDNTNIYNLQKGGNYCVLPNDVNFNGVLKKIVKLDIDPESNFAKFSNYLCLKIYYPDFNIDEYYGEKIFHLDEIFTIIPTGYEKNDYIIFFYKPVCKSNIDFENKLLEIFEYNYNILCKVFGKDRIYLFNTEFTPKATFTISYIANPPLFNRLLIRKNDIFYIYFPIQVYYIYKQISNILDKINKKHDIINYTFINTTKLHNLGGNLHCAFKAI